MPFISVGFTALEVYLDLQDQQPFIDRGLNLDGWIQDGLDCGGSQKGISARGLERPCDTWGMMTTSLWESNEGVIKVGTGTPTRVDSFSIYADDRVYPYSSSYHQYKYHSRFYREVPTSYPETPPAHRYEAVPVSLYEPYFAFAGQLVTVFPPAQPILQPQIPPQNFPYNELSSLPDFTPWREAGYSIGARRVSADNNHPWVSQEPQPNEEPNYLPPVEIINDPVQQPVAEPFHVRRPPRSGEKEIKARTVQAFRGISTIFNPLTEGKDVIDILYSAVPKKYRPRYKDTSFEKKKVLLPEKMLTVYQQFENIDWSKAIPALLQNELEDRVYAFAGKIGKRNSQLLQKPVGTGINTVMGNMPRF